MLPFQKSTSPARDLSIFLFPIHELIFESEEQWEIVKKCDVHR